LQVNHFSGLEPIIERDNAWLTDGYLSRS
jgi:hypothetical protein